MSPFKHLVTLMESLKEAGVDLHVLFPYPESNEDGSQDTCIRMKGLTYFKDDSSVGYYYGPTSDIDEGEEKGYLFEVMEQNYTLQTSLLDFNILPVIREAEYVKHPLTGAYIYRIKGVPFIYSDDYEPEEVTFQKEEEEGEGWEKYSEWFGAKDEEEEEEEETNDQEGKDDDKDEDEEENEDDKPMLSFIQLYKYMRDNDYNVLQFTSEYDEETYYLGVYDYDDVASVASLSPKKGDYTEEFYKLLSDSTKECEFLFDPEEGDEDEDTSAALQPTICIFLDYEYNDELADDFDNNPEKYSTVNDEFNIGE